MLMIMRAMEWTNGGGVGEINNVNFRSQLIERKGCTIHESRPTVLSRSCQILTLWPVQARSSILGESWDLDNDCISALRPEHTERLSGTTFFSSEYSNLNNF